MRSRLTNIDGADSESEVQHRPVSTPAPSPALASPSVVSPSVGGAAAPAPPETQPEEPAPTAPQFDDDEWEW